MQAPGVLFVHHTAWKVVAKEAALWKSTDGGETWTNITAKKGLPKGVWGIVGVAVAPSNPDKVYALIENAAGGMYASTRWWRNMDAYQQR